MKKKLLKSFLLAVTLLVGGNAWADVTTYTWDLTDTNIWSTATVSTGSSVTLSPTAAAPGVGEYGVTFNFEDGKGIITAANGLNLSAASTGTSDKNFVSISVPVGFKLTVYVNNTNQSRGMSTSVSEGSLSGTTWDDDIYYRNTTTSAVIVGLWAKNPKDCNYIKKIVLEDFSSASAHTWSAKAIIKGTSTELTTWTGRSVWEGESYYVNARKVIKDDGGNYYELDDTNFSDDAPFCSKVMGDADVEHTITYSLNPNIVYFTEGEDKNSGQKTVSDKCSGGNYVGYVSGNWSAGTIGAGIYRMETYQFGGRINYGLKALESDGSTEIVNLTGKKYQAKTFTRTASSEIKLGLASGNNGASFDYVLIRKLSDNEPFADGNYYLKNKATGAYFAGGKNWGTQAITNSIGHVVGLAGQTAGYNINTYLYNGGTSSANHFLNGLWCDGAATTWGIISDGAGYYTINDGSVDGNLVAGASGEVCTLSAATSDYAKWTVLTEAQWKAENVARLDAATAVSGVDATFYIPGANFSRNDDDANANWQGSYTLVSGSDWVEPTNYNAQEYNTTFNVYQDLTGLKPGKYVMKAQGFYRNGTTDDQNAYLYANPGTEVSVALMNIRTDGQASADADKGFTTANAGATTVYVPNLQKEAALAFNNDYYNNELTFVVGAGGTATIGVKKTTAVTNDWTVFDNFMFTYYGQAIVNVATEFINGSTMEANTWYYYDIINDGDYFVTAPTLANIVYTTTATDAITVAGTNFASATPALTAGRYYIKSSTSQTLSFKPKTIIATYNFEDGNNLFTAYNSGKITVSNETSGPSEWADGRVQKFAYKEKGQHNFAYFNFSDLVEGASTVTVEFDFYVTQGAGQNLISIADANYHTGALAGFNSNSNSGYGSNGAIFNLGCIRKGSGTSATNYFGVNTTQDADLKDTGLNAWCHATLIANNVTKKVNYVIKNASNVTIKSGNVDYLNENGFKCTQIDVYTGATSASSPIYIDNLSITGEGSLTDHNYVINLVSGSTILKEVGRGMCAEEGSYSSSILNEVISDNDDNYYVLDDGQTGISNYTATYTMGTADVVKEITYTKDATIEYFAEGETFYSAQAEAREGSSGGKHTKHMASTANETGELSGGTYKMEVYVTGRYDKNPLKVYDATGTYELATTGATGSSSFAGIKETGTFVATAGSTVKVGLTDANSLSFDYFIIRKTSSATTVSATLGANGFTTFASVYPLDLANLPTGLTAYKAAVDAVNNKVLFTPVTEAVQANTGLLLKGTSTEYDVPVVASGSDISASNALLVNTGGNTFTAESGYTYYGMIKDSNPLTFGTFNPSSVAIPANKAYLKVSTTIGSRLIASFDDDATAVFDLNDKSEMTNDKWYDLQGRRIDGSRLNPGIYIVNGRKVVVK